MANSGKDDNKSQFFFTFGLTPELQNKHTIFGKVVGNTIYNMLKLQEGVVDEDERPKYPNKILRTKVIKNPFDDLKPRNLIEMIKGDDDKDKKPKSKMKATKDFKLLSFGDEAEEEEEELDSATKQLGAKGKSAHDLLDDEKLSSEVGIEPAARAGIKRKNESSEDEEESSEPVKEREPVNIDSIKDKLSKKKGKAAKEKIAEVMDEDFEGEGDEYVDEKTKARRKKEEIQKEIKALKKEMKTPKEKPPTNTKEDDEEEPESKNQMTEEEKNNDMLRAYHEEQGKYAAKKNKGGPKKGSAREQMTLQLLAKFKEKLHTVKYDEDEEGNRKEREADDVNDHDEEEEGDGWMKNPLKFESNDPVQAKDANRKDDDWFDIYDPRNPINKRRREQDGKNMKR
jgi:peptidyl-prolyl cis-trans isomerase SDCCAG10